MYKTQNFSAELDKRFSCSCCGLGGLKIPTLIILETIKKHFDDKPVVIHSGARCKKHNDSAGSSDTSEHFVTPESRLAGGVDCHVEGVSVQNLYLYVKSLPYANLLGIGKYKTFVHIDPRGYAARWVGDY